MEFNQIVVVAAADREINRLPLPTDGIRDAQAQPRSPAVHTNAGFIIDNKKLVRK